MGNGIQSINQLNVRTDEEVRRAIHRVYGSRQSERVKTYSRVKGMGPAHEVAVVVQEMVPAESSGVLFTANPVTGQRDQAMISAAWGLGEAIVGGLVTPDTLAPAQRYAPLREEGLADAGLSYPLLRQMLRELGRRFAKGGMIETADDIFWLQQDEVELAAARLDRGKALSSLSAIVPQRKVAWRAAKRATPPRMLPQIKFLAKGLEATKTARARRRAGETLKGVAASPGSVTTAARVLHGPEDFDQMQTGDVLVAAITTPAWTPLFVRAAAVVTDVGGPLSHGSIVAREYGIPAVLGTGSATKRIRNGQVITADGSAGVVSVSD